MTKNEFTKSDTMMPHDSPKMHPITHGIGKRFHSTSQSRMTTNPVKMDPINDPKEANRRVIFTGSLIKLQMFKLATLKEKEIKKMIMIKII